jgi:hypothetical protein
VLRDTGLGERAVPAKPDFSLAEALRGPFDGA